MIDAFTNGGLADVRVTVDDSIETGVTTDANGEYAKLAIPDIRAYTLNFRRAGYLPLDITLQPEFSSKREVTLTPGWVLKGCVRDLDGNPVQGAEIGSVGCESAFTDPSGRFEFHQFRRDVEDAVFGIRAAGYATLKLTVDPATDPERHPDAWRNGEMQIVLAPLAALKGTVSVSNGESLSEAKLYVPGPLGKLDAEGTRYLNRLPGRAQFHGREAGKPISDGRYPSTELVPWQKDQRVEIRDKSSNILLSRILEEPLQPG
ncbi:MAG: carboxypeptidase-like regulatory domain-containing protein [Planctomycetota bacterium]